MPLAKPPPESLPYHRKGSFRAAIVALWAFVALTVITMTAVGQAMKSGKLDPLNQIIWDIGWIGWAPLTFVVLAICRRHPIDRKRKLTSVLRLALYGVGVVLVEVAFDFACNMVLGSLLRNNSFTWRSLLYIGAFKAHIYYGVYWMIVGAAHAYEYHARYLNGQVTSSQLETKLANAQLSLLKVQLQPHFLFNAHNAIVGLMLKPDNEAAIRMLTKLSDLLRISLSRANQQLVSLHDEMETLGLYLDIQRERFRDRLTIRLEIPAELEDAELPHLILQPLVENALQHGLENVTEDGRLEIRAWREGATLAIAVRDNGCGFTSTSGRDRRSGDAGGIGLSNTRERLHQLYGAAQSLEIRSAPGHGTTITVRIPYRVRAALQAATV
jgi:two-component system, LytTR family, sensor kinase